MIESIFKYPIYMTLERKPNVSSESASELFINDHKIKVSKVTRSNNLVCATLGPSGTYSESATLQLLNNQVDVNFLGRIREVIESVSNKKFDLGVVPTENSIEGNVEETIKSIVNSDLTILGEKILPIHQALLGTKTGFEKKVLNSHPQGIAQCGKWISENFPDSQIGVHNSTALAVQYAAERDELAIGSPTAAKLYGLPIIQENIEDRQGNTTRFWLIGRGETQPTGNDRTKLAFTIKNEAGTLIKVLKSFSDRNISINKLDTTPLTLDHYYFLLSVDGHILESHVNEAIDEAKDSCWRLKIIGSYEKSMLPNIEYEPEAYINGWIPSEN